MSTLNGCNTLNVTAHTTSFTLTANDNGSCHTNAGATGAIVATLPAATPGLYFFFSVAAVQELRIDPAALETISLVSSGVPGVGGKYLTADAIGETVTLRCFVAGNWASSGNGTWTAEA